jgi:hypothetical protein
MIHDTSEEIKQCNIEGCRESKSFDSMCYCSKVYGLIHSKEHNDITETVINQPNTVIKHVSRFDIKLALSIFLLILSLFTNIFQWTQTRRIHNEIESKLLLTVVEERDNLRSTIAELKNNCSCGLKIEKDALINNCMFQLSVGECSSNFMSNAKDMWFSLYDTTTNITNITLSNIILPNDTNNIYEIINKTIINSHSVINNIVNITESIFADSITLQMPSILTSWKNRYEYYHQDKKYEINNFQKIIKDILE